MKRPDPTHRNCGLAGIVAPRRAKRATEMLSDDKARAAESQAILDQCRAPWWDPDLFWAKAWSCPANAAEHGAPAAAPAALGHVA